MLKQPVGQKLHTNIAVVPYRHFKDGKEYKFEIACYRNKVQDYLNGAESDLAEVLQAQGIFTSVTNGEHAKLKDLKACFGSSDFTFCAKEILRGGQQRLTDKEREHTLESMHADVISQVSSSVMDASDGMPLTPSQIETALEALGFRVKPCPSKKRPEEHTKILAREAVKILEEKLPNRISRVNLKLRLKNSLPSDLDLSISQKIRRIEEDVIIAHPSVFKILKDAMGENALELLDSKVFEPIELNRAARLAAPPTKTVQPPSVLVTSGPECHSCGNLKFASTVDMRSHFRSTWHAFNQKRSVKKLAPLNKLEFDSLPESLKTSFQAVDE